MKRKQNYKVLDSTEVKQITNGTCFQGDFCSSYGELLSTFGPPTYDTLSGDEKVQVEWILLFDDGRVATIYDWKEYETSVEYVTTWHVGGKNGAIVPRVEKILQEMTKEPIIT